MDLSKILQLLRNRVIRTLFLIILLLLTLSPLWNFFSAKTDQWHRQRNGIPEGVRLENVDISGYYPEEVRNLLIQEAKRLARWPVSANIDHSGVISPEIWGRVLDLEATMQLVLGAKSGEMVRPVYAQITPDLIAQEIIGLSKVIGVYYTMVGGTEDRLQNIKVGGKLLNYTLVMPGEVFSFVKTVGEPTPERGFREAPIIVGEEFVPGYGGGLCQISTTLYNAVLKAKLKVVERYPHSQPIKYVPPDKDAAVAYDYLDFKFQNNRKHPILIRVWVWGRRLQVGIYGPAL